MSIRIYFLANSISIIYLAYIFCVCLSAKQQKVVFTVLGSITNYPDTTMTTRVVG